MIPRPAADCRRQSLQHEQIVTKIPTSRLDSVAVPRLWAGQPQGVG